MKLYFAPGVCSMAAHITAIEAGIPLEIVRVDIRKTPHRVADGRDLRDINPKGVVPVLELDDGSVLTEGVAILIYLADLIPQAAMAPAQGNFDRYRLHEWLTFVSTELHKTFSPWMFHPEYGEQAGQIARTRIVERYDLLERHLGTQSYLVGDRFTVADAYCYTILSWSKGRGIDLSTWPALAEYQSRIGERASVREAATREGLRP